MKFLYSLNLLILFLVEVAMLASFFVFGLSLNVPLVMRMLVALAIPTLVAVLWSMYFAPKASRNLAQPWNALGEYALFGLGGLALVLSDHGMLGIILIVVAFMSETISLLNPAATAQLHEK